jgi:hypothetical protein
VAALLLEDRPGGEPTVAQATACPLGTIFAFDEIGWLETEALSARLRAAWPMRTVDGVTMLADAHRVAPAFGRLAEHPRLLAAAAPVGGARLVASWMLFDGAVEPPLRGDVRIIVALSGEVRGDAWRVEGRSRAFAGGIRLVADYVGGVVATTRATAADDALWPCALACAG